MGGVPSVRDLSKGFEIVFTRVSEKTKENSERLGRKALPEIEPGSSCLPVFEHKTAKPLVGPRTHSFDIHALPRIRTRDLLCSSRLP